MKKFFREFLTQPLTALKNLGTPGWLLVVALGALFILLTDAPETDSSATTSHSANVASLDTFIPPGTVLIPIELENYNSVDSILGRYGVVDLFQSDPARPGKNQLVARKIKVIRAPQNPSQLAVLVPESEASRFFKENSVFFAAVQNPKETGTAFEETPTKRQTRQAIVFEESL